MNAVMLSGGWESALCLIVALENSDGHAFFFNYEQPYKEQELKAVYKLQKKFEFDLSVIDINIIKSQKGIYSYTKVRA
jgi:7-cyano-7-deazaguanine synthase in queuosine biosynthesis